MFFEQGNEGKVWESCTSYAIVRVITVRAMQSAVYLNADIDNWCSLPLLAPNAPTRPSIEILNSPLDQELNRFVRFLDCFI